MTRKWTGYPFFLLLLPVFFVFHGYVENYYFMSFGDCLPILGIYLAGAAVLYGIAWLLLRDRLKAALLAVSLLAIYFFFGAGHDFLRRNNIFLRRYSLLLPTLAIAVVLLAIYLKRRSSFGRLPLFLNCLLLVYMLWDTGALVRTLSQKKTGPSINYSALPVSGAPCDSCAKPDIFFIVFDDYCNSRTLKDVYHYDNSGLDSFLVSEGFRIQSDSRSNYAGTLPSMASILNYSYLDSKDGITFRDYADLLDAISKSRVVNFLYTQGYSVVNYSSFDLPGHPSNKEMPFIPTKARLITNRTLLNYLVRDLEASMKELTEDPIVLGSGMASILDRENSQVMRETLEESRKKTGQPRFVYTHLFMPHPPFLFDSLRRRRTPYDIASHVDEDHLDYYLGYLPYTNDCARTLISTIRKNTNGQAVILFMSDHGFRFRVDGKITPYFFHNQNAIYFPDKDYRLLNDSLSAVNEFRVVFDKLFRAQLPLLKDSTTYLAEK